MSIFGSCDKCDKHAFLVRCRAQPRAVETYACKACCGIDPREWAEDEDQHVVKALAHASGDLVDDEQDI